MATDEDKTLQDEELEDGYTVTGNDLLGDDDGDTDDLYDFGIETTLSDQGKKAVEAAQTTPTALPHSESYTRNTQALSQFMAKPEPPEDEQKKLRQAYAKQDVANFAQGITALASLWGASKGAYPTKTPDVDMSAPILSYIQKQDAKEQSYNKAMAQAAAADLKEQNMRERDAIKRMNDAEIRDKEQKFKSQMQEASQKAIAEENEKKRKHADKVAKQKRKHDKEMEQRRFEHNKTVAGIRSSSKRSSSNRASDKSSHFKELYEQCVSADPDIKNGNTITNGALKEYRAAHGIIGRSGVDPESFVKWCKINKRGIYKNR